MMKKIYIMPETEVYLVKSAESVMLSTSDTDANESEIFSKETDWEDEEDDDY